MHGAVETAVLGAAVQRMLGSDTLLCRHVD
jgi:hypothetical protein